MILNSPYRLLVEPLVSYIREIASKSQPNEVITVVVPQFVPRRRWHNVLHARAAMTLFLALVFQPGIVITSVPCQVGDARRRVESGREGSAPPGSTRS